MIMFLYNVNIFIEINRTLTNKGSRMEKVIQTGSKFRLSSFEGRLLMIPVTWVFFVISAALGADDKTATSFATTIPLLFLLVVYFLADYFKVTALSSAVIPAFFAVFALGFIDTVVGAIGVIIFQVFFISLIVVTNNKTQDDKKIIIACFSDIAEYAIILVPMWLVISR